MSNNNEKEIDKNNKNLEQKVSECSSNSDINNEQNYYSRKQLKKTYVCSVKDCGKEFWYEISYKIHLRGSHSEKILRCDHLGCNYVTGNEGHLKSHLILHSDERPLTCSREGCGKTFKRKSDLLVSGHQINHKLKSIQCTREGCDTDIQS